MTMSAHISIKKLRTLNHLLKPIVIVTDASSATNIADAIEVALHNYEVIKVKINISDRVLRRKKIDELVVSHAAQLVHSIGKVAVLYRQAEKPKAHLTNLRHLIK